MTKHKKLQAWVSQMADLCQPDQVVWCDGSESEYNAMWELLVNSGTAKKLNESLRPNSYLVRSGLKTGRSSAQRMWLMQVPPITGKIL